MPVFVIACLAICAYTLFGSGCTHERVQAIDTKQRTWMIDCGATQYSANDTLLADAKCTAFYIKETAMTEVFAENSDVSFLTIPQCRMDIVAATAIVNEDFVSDPDWLPVTCARASYGLENKTGKDEAKDLKLMQFLAEHQHTTPFEHLSATLLIEMPIFVTREWHRHRTQSYSEISMRYTSKPARRFWIPEVWRSNEKPDGNKQGSGAPLSPVEQLIATNRHMVSCISAYGDYMSQLSIGVCAEQARACLPVGTITTMFATANLLNWFRFWKLRIAPNAMEEIRLYAARLDIILERQYPKAWGTLIKATEHI